MASLLAGGGAPFLQRIQLLTDRIVDGSLYPFTVPVIEKLDLRFTRAVTFIVGENGCGKSTLIESIAGILGIPPTGGGKNDLAEAGAHREGHDAESLANALRPSFRQRPPDTYFFRGEFAAHFARVVEARAKDPSFGADPYASYGGRSLVRQSHGESFLATMQHRFRRGLYLLDEPEAALSPQRQLALMALLHDRTEDGSQFIIATHSPILMTLPGAEIKLIEEKTIRTVPLEETEHYQITRSILSNPEVFWRHLRE